MDKKYPFNIFTNREITMKKSLEKVMYMGIGAVIALLSFSLGNLHRNTANAQGEAPIVDLIRCRQLEIVNADGLNNVILSSNEQGGSVEVFSEELLLGKVRLSINENGGEVSVRGGKNYKNLASLGISTHGGSVSVRTEDDKGGAALGANEDGGAVGISGKEGKIALLYNDKNGVLMDFYGREDQRLSLAMTDKFGGTVLISGEGEQGGVFLSTDEYGGSISILNNVGKIVGQFSVSDIGSGMLNTRDKHGYKTGSVP